MKPEYVFVYMEGQKIGLSLLLPDLENESKSIKNHLCSLEAAFQ